MGSGGGPPHAPPPAACVRPSLSRGVSPPPFRLLCAVFLHPCNMWPFVSPLGCPQPGACWRQGCVVNAARRGLTTGASDSCSQMAPARTCGRMQVLCTNFEGCGGQDPCADEQSHAWHIRGAAKGNLTRAPRVTQASAQKEARARAQLRLFQKQLSVVRLKPSVAIPRATPQEQALPQLQSYPNAALNT